MAQQLIQLENGAFVEKWQIARQLGSGAFGAIYIVYDSSARNRQEYAMKVECSTGPVQLLQMEVMVLESLQNHENLRGSRLRMHFCKIFGRGRRSNFNFVVMTLVGTSLEKLTAEFRRSKGAAIEIGIQCLEAVEALHRIGYLHRDVKPANFAVGRGTVEELRTVYILDFGMCRSYVNKLGEHHNRRVLTNFRGTMDFASVNAHEMFEQSRRDDVESWFYMLIVLTTGTAPWINRGLETHSDFSKAKMACRRERAEDLFNGTPRQYRLIMAEYLKLGYFDEPNYRQIYVLLKEALVAVGGPRPFEWEQQQQQQQMQPPPSLPNRLNQQQND